MIQYTEQNDTDREIQQSNPSSRAIPVTTSTQEMLKMAIYIAETCPRWSKFNVSLLTGGDL
ncbi:hypothetical protein NQ317_007322 [Molorchus minor]|uniref:Transposase n=1 Tax=Molorchus minor TaxID=1323400 RepID=A0ABQ9IWN2_9CUCU|nr:hypothetical protein NQ317_007322 [Molorchus minor]